MLYIYKIKKDRERLAVEAGLSVRLNELNRELEEDIEQRKLLEARLRQHIDKYERLLKGPVMPFLFSMRPVRTATVWRK